MRLEARRRRPEAASHSGEAGQPRPCQMPDVGSAQLLEQPLGTRAQRCAGIEQIHRYVGAPRSGDGPLQVELCMVARVRLARPLSQFACSLAEVDDRLAALREARHVPADVGDDLERAKLVEEALQVERLRGSPDCGCLVGPLEEGRGTRSDAPLDGADGALERIDCVEDDLVIGRELACSLLREADPEQAHMVVRRETRDQVAGCLPNLRRQTPIRVEVRASLAALEAFTSPISDGTETTDIDGRHCTLQVVEGVRCRMRRLCAPSLRGVQQEVLETAIEAQSAWAAIIGAA